MKIKKVSKKLVLNRATVANLSDFQMDLARGGVTFTSFGVPHLCLSKCPAFCQWASGENCPATPACPN